MHPTHDEFRRDTLAGLGARPKYLLPKYFYDRRGSELFTAICQTPEYYPTRTELGILRAGAAELARLVGARPLIIEFGAGESVKIRLLLDAFAAQGGPPIAYVPLDISHDFLHASAADLRRAVPGLRVEPLTADFMHTPIAAIEQALPDDLRVARPRLGFFPGSTIGNFTPEEAAVFLARACGLVGPGGDFLIGVDLEKDRRVLHAAYNDEAGVTREFNLNILRRINRELGGDIDLDNFEHRAFYDEAAHRIEMHLVSRDARAFRVAGHAIHFTAGETIHTESSYKYTEAAFTALARAAGFEIARTFTDERRWFGVFLLRAL